VGRCSLIPVLIDEYPSEAMKPLFKCMDAKYRFTEYLYLEYFIAEEVVLRHCPSKSYATFRIEALSAERLSVNRSFCMLRFHDR